MIGKPAADRVGDGCEPPRCHQVRFAWGWVTARVIVSEEDRVAPVPRRVQDDAAQRKADRPNVTFMPREVKAERLVVQMGDQQVFATNGLFGEATGEEFTRGAEAGQFQREFGTLIPHRLLVVDSAAPDDMNRVDFGDEVGPVWSGGGSFVSIFVAKPPEAGKVARPPSQVPK